MTFSMRLIPSLKDQHDHILISYFENAREFFGQQNEENMTSTLFIVCLMLAAVMITIHPALCIPFVIAAYLMAGKGNMHMDSNASIIMGIIGFILLLVLFVIVNDALK
ncbi:hypothetical protein EFV68_13185 [Yersinia enterocolitica]|nr:hypothetical protein [Yersinia enterocolitica]EKN5135695.1 hypothetical protein [Yersinia enterocolitica]EKN6169135.1 hypothetical protein [Yersinia enterocolitica]EKN6294978.1 hypothetical protein [Yersinia enterocolitica]EKN6395813.1 hypothetical protein [Yersinia enterocolitica]